jgi:hypothetical protein
LTGHRSRPAIVPVRPGHHSVIASRDTDTTLALTEALLPRWRDVTDSGHADDDLSVVYARAA